MSNIFVKGTAPFYPVPQDLVNSGKLKKLSEGAHKLYQLILFNAQKRTRVAMELSNQEIRELAGLSPNTIRRGRTQLLEIGLVELKNTPGGRWTYIVLNPLTGRPVSGPDLEHRQSRAKSPTAPISSLAWSDLAK